MLICSAKVPSRIFGDQLLRCSRSISINATRAITTLHNATPVTHLALSPLMDDAFKAAKARYHEPKAKLDKQQISDFQRRLYKNPYALALATPVRECNVSRLRLPKYFLQGYNLMRRNEKDEEAWWVPVDLVERIGQAESTSKPDHGDSVADNIPSTLPIDIKDETSQSTTSAHRSNAKGPTVYTLSSQPFLRNMAKKSTFTRAFEDTQNANHLRSRQLSRASHFRKDADSFNLELMRRRVVEDLTRLIKSKRGYVTHISKEVQKRQVGALLWTGSAQEGRPKDFSTLDVGECKIPIYDLTVLLGQEKLEELRKTFSSGIFDKEMLGLRHKKMTVELQMGLWKLQGYLADYEEFMTEG